MNQKELTKTVMMISNWEKTLQCVHGLYEKCSALYKRKECRVLYLLGKIPTRGAGDNDYPSKQETLSQCRYNAGHVSSYCIMALLRRYT